MDDFVYIRDQKSSRETFLTQQGQTLPGIDHHWRVQILSTRTVAGEEQYLVFAELGKNGDQQDTQTDGAVAEVFEIWKISSGNPILLDRSTDTTILD